MNLSDLDPAVMAEELEKAKRIAAQVTALLGELKTDAGVATVIMETHAVLLMTLPQEKWESMLLMHTKAAALMAHSKLKNNDKTVRH